TQALLNTDNSINPIYVSPGHLISLDTACEIVLKMSRFRAPEPIRLADQISREKIRLLDAGHCEYGEDSSFDVWECEDTSDADD
ncbi:Endonuclease V, partial [Fasciolopsis buskii]